MRSQVGWGGGRVCVGLCVCFLLPPRFVSLPFSCPSLFACSLCFFFSGGGGGCGVFGAGRGCGCVLVPLLVWAWVSWGTGVWVAVALPVPYVCVGPQASGFRGAGPGGVDGGCLAAVVAWRLRGWSRLLGGVVGRWLLCGCVHGAGRLGGRQCGRGWFMLVVGWGGVGVGYVCAEGVVGWAGPCGRCNGWRRCWCCLWGGCCRRRNRLVLLTWVHQAMRREATGLVMPMVW